MRKTYLKESMVTILEPSTYVLYASIIFEAIYTKWNFQPLSIGRIHFDNLTYAGMAAHFICA